MPSILLLGATGCVGSHLVIALKKEYPTFPVTAYLRNKSIEKYLYETAGVQKIVYGTFEETEKLAALAKDHDIVINVGSSFDPVLTRAILAGLNQRPAGVKSTLIHMSGAGNFVDTESNTGIANPNCKVWNDSNVKDMELINSGMLNGAPDEVILNAGKEGKIGTYILFPTALYGRSTGPVKSPGVIQSLMIRQAKELGYVPYIGDGTVRFNTMHVLDIIPPLLRMIDLSLQEETPQGSVYERCYIIGANLNRWIELSAKFAEVFHARGLIPSPIPKSIKREDVDDGGELAMLMSRDQLFLSERAEKTLGYKPTQKPLVEDLQTALEYFDL
ncbi:hypothetical protein VE01_07983 [Pseudogymnoascus verrucosus]|uniref:NAD(P)-binding domain-containing protein n=1 Tax=Pseudogymnoascus verrucosus TaxID=342668 RepID=A0A1B8GFQ9_9PEZI|nr:uncharacterized protein VE01_07983 [Pseudogymnoascus verrucosus]OBT94643.1 hypothetical protein VE01_07983 [Pseudogymnoascus verrucosus]